MTTGTKSLLFGVHQFIWHPITVARGWRRLYGKWPRGWEWVAILVHDWGYWGCEKMDDAKGRQHPLRGARLIEWLYCKTHRSKGGNWLPKVCRSMELWDLVTYHSRYLSAKHNVEPSKLCWADKMSPVFDPPWFYLLRARLTGEIKEYRANAKDKISANCSDEYWYAWLRRKCEKDAQERRKVSHRS